MTLEELLDQAIALLQRRGRLAYRALERQFALTMLLTMGDAFTPRGPRNGPANAAGVQRVRERGQTRWQDFA
jgi:hypothetical protein